MKKMKFIASVLAMSLLSSLCIGNLSASAATGKSLNLVYDSENSTSTDKYIKAYYEGFDGIIGAAVTVNIEGVTATGAEFTYALVEAPGDSIGHTPNVSNLASGKFSFSTSIVASNEYLTGPDNLFGTFKFVVPEGTEKFTVSIEEGSNITDADWEAYDLDVTSVTVSNVVEDDTTPYVPEVLEATRFDTYKNTVPVDAWSTTIDYSTTAVEGKLTWNIFNGEKTAKIEAATVTGQPTVVYGLFIAGQAAQLDTIESVQLIAE